MDALDTKNIVIFGPAHSGKSTLAGFLRACSMEKYEFEKFVNEKKRELGVSFDKSRVYGYLSDTGKDEMVRPKNNMSTTKEIHLLNISNLFNNFDINEEINVIAIDTPGTTDDDKRFRDQIKSMQLGEFGIYAIEYKTMVNFLSKINTRQETAYIHRYLSPICIWSERSGCGSLAIVLTKVDEGNFSKNMINVMTQKVCDILHTDEIRIIPISIDVDARKEQNILTESQVMWWYKGNTLKDEIENMFKAQNHSEGIACDFAIFDKRFLHTQKTKEPAYRFKCESGKFYLRQEVKIAPVKPLNIATTHFVKSIYHDAVGEVATVYTNEIAGFILRPNKKNPKNVYPSKAMIMTAVNISILAGNVLCLRLYDISSNILYKRLNVLWLGKVIEGFIIEQSENELKVLLNSLVCLPDNKNIVAKTPILLIEALPADKIIKTTLISLSVLERIAPQNASNRGKIDSINKTISKNSSLNEENVSVIFSTLCQTAKETPGFKGVYKVKLL